MPEGAQQLGPLVGVRQHPEGVQGAQRAGERRGGRGRAGPDPQGRVVRQGQVGRERVGQVPGGCGVAHHVGVEGRVRRVRPRHGQTLALVFHPAVLEPHLEPRHAGSHINQGPHTHKSLDHKRRAGAALWRMDLNIQTGQVHFIHPSIHYLTLIPQSVTITSWDTTFTLTVSPIGVIQRF